MSVTFLFWEYCWIKAKAWSKATVVVKLSLCSQLLVGGEAGHHRGLQQQMVPGSASSCAFSATRPLPINTSDFPTAGQELQSNLSDGGIGKGNDVH